MNMYNPYAPNPYIVQGQQQDIGGLAPMFQNISSQQAALNQAMAQNQGLTQQAGQMGGGMNPLAMAMALRKKPNEAAPVTDYSQPMFQYTDPAYQDAGY